MVHVQGNDRRRRLAQERIRAKLRVLEAYVANGVPRDAFVPKSMNEFRDWEDTKLGLAKIGSPRTVSPLSPHNKELVGQVKEAIGRLNAPVGGPAEGALEAEDLTEINQLLIADWHLAQHEIESLRKQVATVLLERERLEQRVGELTRMLSAGAQPRLRIIKEKPGGPSTDSGGTCDEDPQSGTVMD